MCAPLTVAQAAKLAGKAPATIYEWLNDGLKSKKKKGVMWITRDDLVIYLSGRDRKPGSQRDRLARAQGEKFELENAQTRGQLVLASQVQDIFQSMAADMAGRLDGLPGRMAGELAGISDAGLIRERLLNECRSIRSGHADWLGKLAANPPERYLRDEDHPPAAEPDAVPVGRRKPRSPARKRGARPVA